MFFGSKRKEKADGSQHHSSKTDDVLVFDNSASQEYCIALGLLGDNRVKLLNQIKLGLQHIFGSLEDKQWIKAKLETFESIDEH